MYMPHKSCTSLKTVNNTTLDFLRTYVWKWCLPITSRYCTVIHFYVVQYSLLAEYAHTYVLTYNSEYAAH